MQTLGWETTVAVMSAREKVLHRRLTLLRDKEPQAWTGTKFLHQWCWNSICRALSRALEDAKYHGIPLTKAVDIASSYRNVCTGCKASKSDHIETWLDVDADESIVEQVLRSMLGENPADWVCKR